MSLARLCLSTSRTTACWIVGSREACSNCFQNMVLVASSSRLCNGPTERPVSEGHSGGSGATKTERVWLTPDEVKKNLPKVKKLHAMALERGQSLAEMAIAGAEETAVTSALIGASSVAQLEANVAALHNLKFVRPKRLRSRRSSRNDGIAFKIFRQRGSACIGGDCFGVYDF